HYLHYSNQGGRPSSAIRSGPWKLIHDWETRSSRLYHLETDIAEQHDRATSEPEVAARLEADLLRWVRETPAIVPPANSVAGPYDDLAGYFLHGQIANPPH